MRRTAERYLTTDQHEFGDAWRYELIDGRIVAHAAQSPEHGAILAGLLRALGRRLWDNPDGCRPESGSGAVPRSAQRATVRIPDALIRCGESPRVMFEVISPSELRNWTERDAKRGDLRRSRAPTRSSNCTSPSGHATSTAAGPTAPGVLRRRAAQMRSYGCRASVSKSRWWRSTHSLICPSRGWMRRARGADQLRLTGG
jgi:Putative restriction endonuclease